MKARAHFDLLDRFQFRPFIHVFAFVIQWDSSEQALLTPIVDQEGLATDKFGNAARV